MHYSVIKFNVAAYKVTSELLCIMWVVKSLPMHHILDVDVLHVYLTHFEPRT